MGKWEGGGQSESNGHPEAVSCACGVSHEQAHSSGTSEFPKHQR